MYKTLAKNLNTRDFGLINALYNYNCPPPYGAGSHTRLVMETAVRSLKYSEINPAQHNYNEKSVQGEKLLTQINNTDNPTLLKEPIGYFHEKSAIMMIKNFINLKKEEIAEAIDITSKWMHSTPVSELGKGKQTLDPLSGESVKASVALERFCSFLNLNGYETDYTLHSFTEAILDLFKKDEVVYEKVEYEKKLKVKRANKYKKGIGIIGERGRNYKITRKRTLITVKGEEKNVFIFNLMREVETFRKDAERNKSTRRAIMSCTIPMRAFMRIIEEFAKNLCNILPESTVGVGGDEKKDKIINLLQQIEPEKNNYPYRLLVTGDNTKWNETQSPQLMLYLLTMVCRSAEGNWLKETRNKTMYSRLSLEKIAIVCMTVLYQKQLRTGMGFKVVNLRNKYFKYVELEHFLSQKEKWTDRDKEILDEILLDFVKNGKITVSVGMMMGMLNILSTLIGNIAAIYNSKGEFDHLYEQGYREGRYKFIRGDLLIIPQGVIYIPNAKLYILQSSDDFFAIIIAKNEYCAKAKLCEFIRNSKLVGVNISYKKSTFREYINGGAAEYTSWFIYRGDLLPQVGTDAVSIRPTGMNALVDYTNFSKLVQNNLGALTWNYISAEIAIRLNARFLKILYHIPEKPILDLSSELVSFVNGGLLRLTPSRSHLSESAELLKLYYEINDSTMNIEQQENFKKYVRRIFNPSCPLNSGVKEISDFNADTFLMETKEYGIIMNANNIQLRSNMKMSNVKKEDVDAKRAYGLIEKLAVCIKPALATSGTNSKVDVKEAILSNLTLYSSLPKEQCDVTQELITVINDIKNRVLNL